MITDSYDDKTEPIMSLKDFYGEKKHIVDTCLIIFSEVIYQHVLDNFRCEKIAEIMACNGNTPVYKMSYKEKDIAFYLSRTGSALAASCCYECSWITGATKFVMFGSCGSLDRDKTAGRFVVPTESYRAEGLSYHFAPPADYIEIKNADKVARIFDELSVPYVKGRAWTTDSMIRETKGLIEARKSEGVIAVEMELAGVQAICDFYDLQLYNFLEAGDVLADSGYEVEGLQDANHDIGKLYIGLDVAVRL